jgi:diguanylate cyclase (GGDEF)-like protein
VEDTLRRAFAAARTNGQAILRQLPAVFRIGGRDVRVESKFVLPDDAGEPQVAMVLTDITDILQAAERIHYLNYFDKLTSLYNRAYVEMTLPELVKKENLPLSVIMLDMNGLKLVNDVFGHEQGDRLLVALADALTQACRKDDIIGRWGGDEFIVLLPKTPSSVCAEVGAAIRRTMNAAAANPIPLSAAMGMATKDSSRTTLAEILLVAENRMYNNKLIESQEVRRNIVASMEAMLQEHCFENAGHSERVARLAAGFADFLGGLGEMDKNLLNKLATLHDIGKVAIPRQILGKPGPLSARELEIAKSHSDIGYRLAQSIGERSSPSLSSPFTSAGTARATPSDSRANTSPACTALLAVDVYDVLINDRPYRRPWTRNRRCGRSPRRRLQVRPGADRKVHRVYKQRRGQ